ncbi:MAG: (d)CMP kinase [Tenericutes bacterium]|nr:(d)CMP kinase [Mycoplasmatota bacterium]MDY3801661.1 (d)CMP kinase [Bacilli bacterium]
MHKIVAIDGPAGSGKGTVADLVSKECNLVNIDTGATYRSVALKALQNNVIDDEKAIIEISKNIDIKFTPDKKVFLDGVDVTDEIRSKEVTKIVSQVSSIVEVRKNLVELQKKMAGDNDCIMEGRDITTVVFPNAKYKFYLDATPEERARRRFEQNKEKNIDMTYEEILENIKMRDYNDSHKEVGSLTRTDEQIYIDSTNLTIPEVVKIITDIVKGDE